MTAFLYSFLKAGAAPRKTESPMTDMEDCEMSGVPVEAAVCVAVVPAGVFEGKPAGVASSLASSCSFFSSSASSWDASDVGA